MTTCNPCRIVSEAFQRMAYAGEKVTSSLCLAVGQATSKVISVTTRLLKEPESTKSIFLFGISVIEYASLRGASVARFDGLVNSLKVLNEVITARSIVGRVDEVTSGRAFSNIVKLARTTAFLAYDVLGTLKYAEKLELISKGTANVLAFKMVGDSADVARSFFGYMGCSLSIVESAATIQQKGLSLDSLFSVLISTSRVVGFAAPKGTLFSVAVGATTAGLSVVRSIVLK